MTLSLFSTRVHQRVDGINQHQRECEAAHNAHQCEWHIVEGECLNKEHQQAIDKCERAGIFQIVARAHTLDGGDDVNGFVVASYKGVEHFRAD